MDLMNTEFQSLLESLISTKNSFQLAKDFFILKSDFAAALAGTSNRKDPKYKAALRNIERYTTTGAEKRNPGSKTLNRLVEVLKGERGAIEKVLRDRKAGTVEVRFSGDFNVSNESGRKRRFKVKLSEEKLAHLLSTAYASPELAAEVLFRYYGVLPSSFNTEALEIK